MEAILQKKLLSLLIVFAQFSFMHISKYNDAYMLIICMTFIIVWNMISYYSKEVFMFWDYVLVCNIVVVVYVCMFCGVINATLIITYC